LSKCAWTRTDAGILSVERCGALDELVGRLEFQKLLVGLDVERLFAGEARCKTKWTGEVWNDVAGGFGGVVTVGPAR